MIVVYRGDTRIIELAFTNDDGSVLNISGSLIYFTAKRDYEDRDEGSIIQKIISGHAAPESGIAYMQLTSTDTNQCPRDYVAGFQLVDTSGNISTFNTDGLRILPSPNIID